MQRHELYKKRENGQVSKCLKKEEKEKEKCKIKMIAHDLCA
jgi:hypothetical protein